MGTSQGGGTTRRAGPAGNFDARTLHANAGDRGGGGEGSLCTTPRAAARNRANESWRAARAVVAGATPRTEAQRGGRRGLVVETQANFAFARTGSVVGAFAACTKDEPADALAATTTANTHARTAKRKPRCAVVFGGGDRFDRSSWDAATSASSVASVVGSGVVDKAWSATKENGGVASGRASTLASGRRGAGRFGRAAGGVGGTATATGVDGRFVRSPSARRGGLFFVAFAARTSCMARPCMHSSHISSTYIHGSRSTGMLRLVLGPPAVSLQATRSARRAR